ncbi:hypothetical protein CRE_10625 [Caenorhabditis remanei]|uniref:Uncharacterized protein n=1 Tax=Caenorhabditis remanei TaxID=31234 RepID=E3NBL0_CAERE|nr:hypothetical protein CRE_10625 [Caenorhabditis remanei]
MVTVALVVAMTHESRLYFMVSSVWYSGIVVLDFWLVWMDQFEVERKEMVKTPNSFLPHSHPSRAMRLTLSMKIAFIGGLIFSVIFLVRALFFTTQTPLNTFWIQSVFLVYMAYCTILYLLATVIRDCLFPKEKVEDELKKCLMVMFVMDLVIKTSVMIAGWYLVNDIKTMYFFLSLGVLSSLILFVVFIPATPVFHIEYSIYNKCLAAPTLLLLIPYVYFILPFLLTLPERPEEVYNWKVIYMVVSIPLLWFSIFDFLSAWTGDVELGTRSDTSADIDISS